MRGWVLPRALLKLWGLQLGNVGVRASPTIIEADPIMTVPGGGEDLVADQPQINLAPGGPETSGA
jgi:hypothetical protein